SADDCPVSRNDASTPSRSPSHASISPVGRVFPRSIWLRYSFEQRSPASSDWVSPALTRSWRRRAPSDEAGRDCGRIAGGMRVRLSTAAFTVIGVPPPLGISLARVTRRGDAQALLLLRAGRFPELPELRSTRLVQLRVDRARRLRGDAWHALELLLRRREEPLRRPEVLEDRASPDRADTLQLVEDRAERPRLA